MEIGLEEGWMGSGWGLIFNRSGGESLPSWFVYRSPGDFLSPWFVYPAVCWVVLTVLAVAAFDAWRASRHTIEVPAAEILP